MNARRKNRLATLSLIVLLLALPVAAAIQTVWLNSASRGEADRMRRNLTNAARQIRADLSFEFASIARLLSPDLDGVSPGAPADMDHLSLVFPQFYAAWRDQTRFPGLIDEIFYIGPLSSDVPHLYDPDQELFIEVAESSGSWSQGTPWKGIDLSGQVWEDTLTVLAPLSRIVERVPSGDGATTIRVLDPGFLVIRLDPAYLGSVVLPELVGVYFGSDQDDYLVAVVDSDNSELIWSNFETTYLAATSPDGPPPDARASLSPMSALAIGVVEFSGRDVPPDADAGVAQRFRDPLMQEWLGIRSRSGDETARIEEGGRDDFLLPPVESEQGLTALVWHGAGGIESAARAGRNRNLLFSYLALAVLAGSAIAYYALFRRANRLREREHEFVATVTHELRTPVAAIHAVADNLAEGIITQPEKVREYGQAMLDEGRRLRTMIDQVLLYAGLQGGPASGRLSRIRIDDLVTRTVSQVPDLSRDHLIIRVEPNLPGFSGDPVGIESIIRNLLSNAVKHNARSTRISLQVRSESGSAGRLPTSRFNLVIEVSDNGRGIPRKELPQVGEPFFRGAQSQADQIPGSGLGLSLVTRIANTYGGSISVESTVGEGTTVTVRMPFERGEDSES